MSRPADPPEHGPLHSPRLSRAEASGWPAASAATEPDSEPPCRPRRRTRPGPGSRLTGAAADRPRRVLLQAGRSSLARISSLARARRHWQRHGQGRGRGGRPGAGIMIAGPGPREMEPQPERRRRPQAESRRPAPPSPVARRLGLPGDSGGPQPLSLPSPRRCASMTKPHSSPCGTCSWRRPERRDEINDGAVCGCAFFSNSY